MLSLQPSIADFTGLLDRCMKERNVVLALQLHDVYMHQKELQSHPSTAKHLVLVLSEVGSMCHAQQVFDKLLHQDEHSWNVLITSYAKYGQLQRALALYLQMQSNGALNPTRSAFVALIKACTALKDLEKGCTLHAHIARDRSMDNDVFIASTLIDMYAKCGSLEKAQAVFDTIVVRDVVIWTALIGGYANRGHGDKALNLTDQMQHEGILPDAFTLLCSLKACGSAKSPNKGQELHSQIALRGLEGEPAIGNTLVDMYAKCGMLATAQKVFNRLAFQNVVSWTALIGGYAEHGHGEEALHCFKQMQHHQNSSNAVTFICVLKACSSVGAMGEGQDVHTEIIKKGFETDILIGNTLVHMYAKCGLLVEAQNVLDKLSGENIVSCNALLSGYAEHGLAEEALNFFERMQGGLVLPNAITFVCSLKACGCIGATGKGFEIHNETVKQGLERELLVGSTLADMYARGGYLAEAHEVFNTLPVRDVISWTALMTGYAEHDHGNETLKCLEQMQLEGIHLNAATFVCTLKACGSTGAIAKGREMHAELVRKGLESDHLVSSSLVHMYAKCGSLREAQDVFDKLSVKDEVSWNALIAAYAQVGQSESVFSMYARMLGEDKKPDLVTLVSVLNACSHAGLVDKGQMCFEALSSDSGFGPTLEHYTCVIDLLGRSGHVDKAVAIVLKMPLHPSIVVWLTVLGACRRWCNVELGKQAFEHAVGLDKKNVGAYICMYNIYADAAMQEEAMKVVALGEESRAWGPGGFYKQSVG